MKGFFLTILLIFGVFSISVAATYEVLVTKTGAHSVRLNLREESGSGYQPFTYPEDVTFKLEYQTTGTLLMNSSDFANITISSGSPTASKNIITGGMEIEIVDIVQVTQAIPVPVPVINRTPVFWDRLSGNELITEIALLDAINNNLFPDNNVYNKVHFNKNEMIKSEVLDYAQVEPSLLPSNTNEAVIKNEVQEVTQKTYVYFTIQATNIPSSPSSPQNSVVYGTISFYKSSDDSYISGFQLQEHQIKVYIDYTKTNNSTGSAVGWYNHTSGSEVTSLDYPWASASISHITVQPIFNNYIIDKNKCSIVVQNP